MFYLFFTAGSVVQYNAYFGQGSESILASGFGCSGNEETLLQCFNRPTEIASCNHYDDAGVECVGKHYKTMKFKDIIYTLSMHIINSTMFFFL